MYLFVLQNEVRNVGFYVEAIALLRKKRPLLQCPLALKGGVNGLMIVGKTHPKKQDSATIWVDY